MTVDNESIEIRLHFTAISVTLIFLPYGQICSHSFFNIFTKDNENICRQCTDDYLWFCLYLAGLKNELNIFEDPK